MTSAIYFEAWRTLSLHCSSGVHSSVSLGKEEEGKQERPLNNRKKI